MADTKTVDLEETKKQILGLTSHKHVKIWLLHEICLLKNKDIVAVMGSGNVGSVGNTIKDYNEHPAKIEAAKALLK